MAPDREDKLPACEDSQINVALPGPLNARLDALVELANAAGENTSRREVVAGLILEAAESGEELAQSVRRYRTASVGDTVVSGFDEARFLDPAPRAPGRKPRRAG